jgi:GTP-binding protein
MARPLVALVGRPNTGKSTLFNRLVGWRKAIVDKEPGLTRDRLYGPTDWEGREMTVVDTAGLDAVEGLQSSDPAEQTRLAIEQADVIVLLLDARQGLTPTDRDIAEMLRRSGRPVVVAANKADQHGQPYLQHELYELGLDPVVSLSGQHGVGVDDLLDAIVERLPPPPPEEAEEPGSRSWDAPTWGSRRCSTDCSATSGRWSRRRPGRPATRWTPRSCSTACR